MNSFPGQRIVIWGNSCSGKSTLAEQIGELLGIPFVELDALNWQPDWVSLVDTDQEKFIDLMKQATAGDSWVVAGFYSRFSSKAFWDRLDTVIWLDLPRPLLLRRVISRSWKRYRTREKLWGTNYENFWSHLRIWDQKSLIWWIWNTHQEKRESVLTKMQDPDWAHVQFIHLDSVEKVDEWLAELRSKQS